MSNRPPKAALPGEMYQQNGRWWWKVRLPGEPRVRERALKPDGARFAAKTRKVAERVAFEMWRRCIEAEIEKRVREELKEQTDKKIAKAKDKAAEAIARAEKKAKIDQNLRIEAEQESRTHCAALEQAVTRANAEEAMRLEAERRARMEAQSRSIAEARLEAEMELRSEAEKKAAFRVEGVSPSNRGQDARDTVTPASYGSLKQQSLGGTSQRLGLANANDNNGKTAPCEGCGREGIPEHHLERIESGQLVCPECMMLSRA